MKDSTSSLIKSATGFFSGTLLSRVTGLMRDIAMAFVFGTQDATAAFLVAMRFSHLLRRLLGEGALQTAFIPEFEKLRREDSQRAYQFFRDLSWGLTYLLILIISLSMMAFGSTLWWETWPTNYRQIVFFTLLMMPSLLFICLFGLNASLLQCERNFFTPSFAPAAFNLVWMAGTLISGLSFSSASEAMPWLAGFVILGCAAQWFVTLPKTLGILRPHHKKSSSWSLRSLYSSDVRSLLKPLMLGIVGVGAAQINNALDSLFARYASLEGPAFLWYSIRLQQLPLALIGIAISGALLPPLSRAVKALDFLQFQTLLEFALRRSLTLMIPITVAFFTFGDSMINLIYGHGGFNALSVAGTTQCLWGYALGLIPMALVLILAPAFYAQGDYRTTTRASLIAMFLNVGLNTVMIAILEWDAAGVALATSLSAWLNMGWLCYHIRSSSVSFNFSKAFWSSSGKTLLASFLAIIPVLFGRNLSDFFNLFAEIPVDYPTKFSHQLWIFTQQAILFVIAFGGVLWMLKEQDLMDFLKTLRTKHQAT